MRFKTRRILEQYRILPKKLRKICDEFERISVLNGVTPVVTRVADPVPGESGVHLQYRAVDFRNQHVDADSKRRWLYNMELVEDVLFHINEMFPRRDRYKTIIHHSFNGGLYHFHIQLPVYDLTVEDKLRIKNYVKRPH